MRMLAVLIVYGVLIVKLNTQRVECDDHQEEYIRYVRRTVRWEYRKCDRQYLNYGEEYFGDGRQNSPGDFHKLLFHVVCFNFDVIEQKACVSAKVRLAGFCHGTGTEVFPEDANTVKEWLNLCGGSDHLGHIISMEWGGQGYEANIFAQNGNLNMGLWKTILTEIGNFLKSDTSADKKKHVANIKVAFLYEDPNNDKRPSILYYHFELADGDVIERNIFGFIENQAHTGAKLEHCWHGDKTKYNFVVDIQDKYHLTKSCRPDPNAPKKYGPNVMAPTDPRYNALQSRWSPIGDRK